MKVIEIPTQAEGNPLYPLPPDYEQLSQEGQRLARVNACRQWTLQGTIACPERSDIVADRAVASLHFFDHYYLHEDVEAEFDPGFYDIPPLRTPSFHWDLTRAWAIYDLNVALAPRGAAKSTHIHKDTLLRLVTQPRYSVVYATSTHTNADITGTKLRDQCYTNTRIQDDFGREWGGGMKPARGTRPVGTGFFYMKNGSWIKCVSAESRLRGLRPRRFRLDDPEYDEKASTSMEQVRAYMDRLLFKICIPMVTRAGSAIDWVGTFVSKRHFLWHALQLIQTPTGEFKSVDPRFDLWSRMWVRAAYRNPAGKICSVWPEMWPADDEERSRLNIPKSKTLKDVEVIMGSQAFRNEMLGEPGSSDEQYFKLDPNPYGHHSWWVEDVDEDLSQNPRQSGTLICWLHKKSAEIIKMPMREFLQKARLFQTVDTAFTESATSDLRVSMLMALMPDNMLFVLDLWSSRKGDSVLVQQTLKMAQKWLCPSVYVEVVKESFKLYQRFTSTVNTKAVLEMGITHIPRIHDMRPGTMDKTSKIAALDVRFDHGLIKLPVFRRLDGGPWQRLFSQIEGFNPEANDGGLEKDDELDCCAMSLFVIKGRLRKEQARELKEEILDPIKELREGRGTIPGTDIPLIVPLQFVDAATLHDVLRGGDLKHLRGESNQPII